MKHSKNNFIYFSVFSFFYLCIASTSSSAGGDFFTWAKQYLQRTRENTTAALAPHQTFATNTTLQTAPPPPYRTAPPPPYSLTHPSANFKTPPPYTKEKYAQTKTITLIATEPGQFGIQSNTLTHGTTIITAIAAHSLAEKAGLKVNDHILEIDDFPVAQNSMVMFKLITETQIKIKVGRVKSKK